MTTRGFTYERRSSLTIRPQPAINDGYQHWFPELRSTQKRTARLTRRSTDAYPARWLPDLARRKLRRQDRPLVSR